MKIDGEIPDPRAVTVWKSALVFAPGKSVFDFVGRTPALQSGFRPGKMPLKVAADRVQGMLDQTSEMPSSLRRLLSSTGLNGSLLDVLSAEAISEAEGFLRDYFGGDTLYAAMLLADREEVRSMGKAGFSQGIFIHPTDVAKAAARTALNKLFRPFLDIFGCSTGLMSVALPVANRNERGVDVDSEKKYFQQKLALGQQLHELKSLRKELEHAKAELSKLREQKKILEVNFLSVQASLSSEQAKNLALSQTFEQAVNEETERRVTDSVLPWLEPAEQLATTVLQIANQNILDQAEVVLSRQEQLDRRYGLWSELVREHDKCVTMIERLERAKQESIRPLPELGTSVDALVKRLLELERILGYDKPIPTGQLVPEELFKKVQAATKFEELSALRGDLEAGNRIGLLHEKDLSECYRIIQEACWRLYSTPSESDSGREDSDWLNVLPLDVLHRSLKRGDSCLLLVDGHNVIFRLRAILQLEFEGDSPGARARNQLTKKVSTLADTFPSIEVHLWYDGEAAQDLFISKNFAVHYSGGNGRNRADMEIVKYLDSLQYISTQQKRKVKALVTADNALSDEARNAGAGLILAPEELLILFSLPNP
jgi:hypothetical protein